MSICVHPRPSGPTRAPERPSLPRLSLSTPCPRTQVHHRGLGLEGGCYAGDRMARRWSRAKVKWKMSEEVIDQLKQSGLVKPDAVLGVWSAFINELESPMWTRAWSLCVVASYLERIKRAASMKPVQYT